jgi:hypothetical protein
MRRRTGGVEFHAQSFRRLAIARSIVFACCAQDFAGAAPTTTELV